MNVIKSRFGEPFQMFKHLKGLRLRGNYTLISLKTTFCDCNSFKIGS